MSLTQKKSLVVYHFFHKDDSYLENFQHFMLFAYTKEHDYCILIAGDTSALLPQASNIRYLKVQNINNDYGGYCQLFSDHFTDIDQYENYLFINSSVRGPFLLPGTTETWIEKYLHKLDSGTGLVGGTICILTQDNDHSISYKKRWGGNSATHVQTMSYAMHKDTLRYLIESGFYHKQPKLSKKVVIEDYEIRLSQLVLQKGLDLKCLLPEYNQQSYLAPHQDMNLRSAWGDPSPINSYFGRTLSPFEAMFVKTNRGIYPDIYLKQLAYSAYKVIQHRQDLLIHDHALSGYIKKISDSERMSSRMVNAKDLFQKRQKAHINLIHAHRYLKGLFKELKKENQYKAELLRIHKNSLSWKITAPIRLMTGKLKSFIQSIVG
jgi:hypothetical protein